MIKQWYVTGDTHHRVYDRLLALKEIADLPLNEVAIIILGDAGFNYDLWFYDSAEKEDCNSLGCKIYCVRGNHERDPKVLEFPVVYDEEVKGNVYQEEDYLNIKYFIDGAEYVIDGKTVGVFGGAYSVDKDYRIANGKKWFPEEQLDEVTRTALLKQYKNKHLDIVLAHTCPYRIRPTDLFLDCIDQSKVDNTMEYFLDTLLYENGMTFNLFLCGHYHANRSLGPKAIMLFKQIWELNVLYDFYMRKE